MKWKSPPATIVSKDPQSCQTQRNDQVENYKGQCSPSQKIKKDSPQQREDEFYQ